MTPERIAQIKSFADQHALKGGMLHECLAEIDKMREVVNAARAIAGSPDDIGTIEDKLATSLLDALKAMEEP